jgi:hypothetical protein
MWYVLSAGWGFENDAARIPVDWRRERTWNKPSLAAGV